MPRIGRATPAPGAEHGARSPSVCDEPLLAGKHQHDARSRSACPGIDWRAAAVTTWQGRMRLLLVRRLAAQEGGRERLEVALRPQEGAAQGAAHGLLLLLLQGVGPGILRVLRREHRVPIHAFVEEQLRQYLRGHLRDGAPVVPVPVEDAVQLHRAAAEGHAHRAVLVRRIAVPSHRADRRPCARELVVDLHRRHPPLDPHGLGARADPRQAAPLAHRARHAGVLGRPYAPGLMQAVAFGSGRPRAAAAAGLRCASRR
mmetsp:Transcript_37466/g.105827  ORF Transcript_37466/g.105827 Transcript_37466/m.105827 type:complete len:258 (-) Transcript_37466:472-1245(-)